MLPIVSKREKEINLANIKAFINSRKFSQIIMKTKKEKETYSILETFFNGYAFTFILNIDRNDHNKIRDIILLIKDKNKQNKIKYSKHFFFAVTIPQLFSALNSDARIGIALIKESLNCVVGYKNIYQCRLHGNYAYNQKVFCENLYDLPLVFRKFIEENQNKPEELLKFFLRRDSYA